MRQKDKRRFKKLLQLLPIKVDKIKVMHEIKYNTKNGLGPVGQADYCPLTKQSMIIIKSSWVKSNLTFIHEMAHIARYQLLDDNVSYLGNNSHPEPMIEETAWTILYTP